jgi:hypothetical protein
MRLPPWWLIASGLLIIAVATVSIGSRLAVPEPGSLEDALSRVRVGMSEEEAVGTLLVADRYIDLVYIEGETTDGKSLPPGLGFRGLYGLPPAKAIERAKVEMVDDEGRGFTVLFGPGGVVTGKRFPRYRPLKTFQEWLGRL